MREIIVKLTSDHIKVKGGEYVKDYQRGEWVFKDDDTFAGEYFCSSCNERAEVNLYGEWVLTNFCPNCGADMRSRNGRLSDRRADE